MTETVQAETQQTTDHAAIAADLGVTAEEFEARLKEGLQATYLQSFPEDQREQIAIGVIQSQALARTLSAGRPFEVHVVSVAPPTHIEPRDGDPFDLASIMGVGFSKHPDGTDGPVGIVDIGCFSRADTPPAERDVWKLFEPGHTYKVSLSFDGEDPAPGQIPVYRVSQASDTKPEEIPNPDGLNGAEFVKGIFTSIGVEDIPSHATNDPDDLSNWVCVEGAVIAARRGIGKKSGKPYGLYDITAPGTTLSQLTSNPNAKANVSCNDTQVQYTVGSRCLYVGTVQPPSEDGKYDAKLRAKAVIPIVGIPYVVEQIDDDTDVSATESGATDDAADLGGF